MLTVICGEPVQWFGCYADSWKGWIVDEAFQHPAKFARGLIRRILEHGIERDYWQPGQLIGDPFGGVACGGVIAASLGFRWVGLELEAKFVEIGQKNIEAHRNWYAIGKPRPVLLQGDSRRFHEAIEGAVTSPPYNLPFSQEHPGNRGGERGTTPAEKGAFVQYGTDGQQIEGLPNGSVDGAISSPPYASIAAGQGGLNHLPAREDGQQSGRAKEGSQDADQRYGEDPGQIARLREGSLDSAVTSPPFVDVATSKKFKTDEERQKFIEGQRASHPGRSDEALRKMVEHWTDCGNETAQIGVLKAGDLDASVTSPPWEKNCEGKIGAHKWKDPAEAARKMSATDSLPNRHSTSPEARLAQFERDNAKTYGDSDGQIGRESGETYWEAMRKVYASLFRALRPGGYAAIVVKDYVKGGKRVRLCDDTLRLLCHVGFVSVERAHAMLVEESGHHDMFSGAVKMKKERKSFFRRLAEKKGSPPIDYEEVLFVRKPQEGAGLRTNTVSPDAGCGASDSEPNDRRGTP